MANSTEKDSFFWYGNSIQSFVLYIFSFYRNCWKNQSAKQRICLFASNIGNNTSKIPSGKLKVSKKHIENVVTPDKDNCTKTYLFVTTI